MVAGEVVLDDLHRLQLLQTSLLSDLVLALIGIVLEVTYVGDITHIAHLVPQMREVAEEDIEGDRWAGMS